MSIIRSPAEPRVAYWFFSWARKAKHAPLTKTAQDGIAREAAKARLPLDTWLE